MKSFRRQFLKTSAVALIAPRLVIPAVSGLASVPASAQNNGTQYGRTLALHLREAYGPWGLSESMLSPLVTARAVPLVTGASFHERYDDEWGLADIWGWRFASGRIVGVRQSAYSAFGAPALYANLNLRELLSMRAERTREICEGLVVPVGIRAMPSDDLVDSYRKAVAQSSGQRSRWVQAPHYVRDFRNFSGTRFTGVFGRDAGAWRTHWIEA